MDSVLGQKLACWPPDMAFQMKLTEFILETKQRTLLVLRDETHAAHTCSCNCHCARQVQAWVYLCFNLVK